MSGPLLLGKADLALFGDPSVSVHIPALMAMPRTRARAGVLVGPFEGDKFPTAFWGTARSGSFSLTARFGPRDRELRTRLEWLIDEAAPATFDRRLLLRTHAEPGTNLPADLQEFVAAGSSVAVVVFDLTSTPIEALVWDVTFTATIVEHTFAVGEITSPAPEDAPQEEILDGGVL